MHKQMTLISGAVLSLGSRENFVVHLVSRVRIAIPSHVADQLFLILQEIKTDLDPEWEKKLREAGVLVSSEGVPTEDHFLGAQLAAVNEAYSPSWPSALSPVLLESIQAKLIACHASRKAFYAGVGQAAVLPETALRRALMIGDSPLRVLCLGDDDFVSIALASLGHEVTAIDVDPYLLNILRTMRDRFNLSIEIIQYDFRDPVPDKLRNQPFDVLMCDPMSNRPCFDLFLARAFSIAGVGVRGFAAVYGPSAKVFRDVIDETPLHVNAWYRNFNHYTFMDGALNAYQSDWVEFRFNPMSHFSLGVDDVYTGENLYVESYAGKRRMAFYSLNHCAEPHWTRPFFFDDVITAIEKHAGEPFEERRSVGGDDWNVYHCTTAEGHVTFHADRLLNRIVVLLQPASLTMIDAVDFVLRGIHGTEHMQQSTEISGFVCDVRTVCET